MIKMIHMIATLLSLLPLLLMILLILGVISFLCLWIMIRKFYVILILLSLFMIPLKIIMRWEHMLIDISIYQVPSLYVEGFKVAPVFPSYAYCVVLKLFILLKYSDA